MESESHRQKHTMTMIASFRTASRLLASSSRGTPTLVCHSNRIPKNASFVGTKTPSDADQDDNDTLSEWIPPDRPLVGDKGSSHLYTRKEVEMDEEEELRQLELELEREEERHKKQQAAASASNLEEPIDWLQTRRSKELKGVDIMTPDLGTSKKWQDSDVQVIRHTLLTKDEITSCLTAMGGKDITFLPNTPDRRMGAAKGMLIVTGTTPAQIFLLADTLVRQLKKRELADMGVVGAEGAEGSDDKLDIWRVVDCSNYIVHIMEASTRKYLNLELLWSGNDPALHVNLADEDAMDDYVAANPVPEGYSPNTADFSASLSQMERNRWIVPHKPVVARPKGKGRRRGRGRR